MLAGLTIRLVFVIFTPLYPNEQILPGYNDEPLHLKYVSFVASERKLPVWTKSNDDARQVIDQYVQPPLYYTLSAPFFALGEFLNRGSGLYLVRFFSLIFGLVAGWFTYRLALLCSKDERLALGAAAAVLFSPNGVVFTSLVTNDALLLCLSAMVLYMIVRSRVGDTTIKHQVLIGLLAGCAVWTKMSGLLLLPLILLAVPDESTRRDRWFIRIRVFSAAVIVIIPLVVWNYIRYAQVIPLAAGYSPEEVLGVSGGAVNYPIMAAKIWIRTAAIPFDSVWGSLPEKLVSAIWTLWWGSLTLAGGYLLIRSSDWIFPAVVMTVVAGFIIHNIDMFQVEFRLLTPAFPALAVLAARGASVVRVNPAIQAVLWAIPLIVLPLLR